MEEKDLVQQSKEGNEEAFAALVNKYKTKVFNLAYSLTRNRETADDMAQEVFIKAFFALSKFNYKSKFGTWLYRITVNHVKDYFRKKGRIREISIEDIRANSPLKDGETAKRDTENMEKQKIKLVHQAIQSLPEKHKIILSLRDIQGFSYEEISKILKVSPGTVDSRLHRARKILRKKLIPFFNQKGGNNEM